ncbi:hypothetical protein ABIC16_000969 [Sphingomonas sp. PvP055]|uniref:hypothetical protein n=1 Tax=Sphingomonas sp. PvP055 TaxID=3156391 RepID=UPI0033917F4C
MTGKPHAGAPDDARIEASGAIRPRMTGRLSLGHARTAPGGSNRRGGDQASG